MFLASGPELVIAACRAGIIGAFPAPNARTPDVLAEWLSTITSSVFSHQGVWAANLVMHSSYGRRAEDLALVAQARPPLVITALGSPRDAVDAIHAYGGLVFADVNSIAFARKAIDAGADGLVLVASGAGGHTGQLSGFAFVESVRQFFDGPLALAGSISSGRGIRAAEILGADLAYMGTRFLATTESMAPAGHKQMIIDAQADQIVCSASITGVHANWLKQSLERAGYTDEYPKARAAADFGRPHDSAKAWKDVWSAGQGVGSITGIESMAAVVNRLEDDYRATVLRGMTEANGPRISPTTDRMTP